jgi:MFS family permease
MNSLSWFLYLAEVIPNIGGLFVAIAALLAIAPPIWGLFTPEIGRPPPIALFAVAIVVSTIIAIIIPSKQTIYLIAGSEAGEYVITSPEGQEIINDIKSIIKSQIEELK